MHRRIKISPNDQCPCWSGKKYKKCCSTKVDWPALLAGKGDPIPHFSARGRNLLFAEAIFDALQIDNEQMIDRANYKRAFTAKAVRKIHEAILELWPPNTDLKAVFDKGASKVSGLYVGDYESDALQRAIVRHCLYADKILLVDPFPHPYVIAPKYNPIENPEQHRAQTLKNVNRFLRFLPWVDAGLVDFIATPADLNRETAWDSMKRADQAKADPILSKTLEESAKALGARYADKHSRSMLLLASPDSYLRELFRKTAAESSSISEDDFMEYIEAEREKDPDFLEPMGKANSGQLFTMSTGGTIEVAAKTAEMSGAYLFTDIKVRWEMIKRDRENIAPESRVWSPFAKAVQDAKFSFLDNVSLESAISLRSQGRLEGVRKVLRNAWTEELSPNEFDEANAISLGENLTAATREAESEWLKIKAELAKFRMTQIAGSTIAAGPLISNGHAHWLGAAVLASATTQLVVQNLNKRSFQKRYPASFFMEIAEPVED